MSALVFDRRLGRIGLFGLRTNIPVLVGIWSAHNEIAKRAVGAWPAGMYKWAYYNLHAEEGLFPAASHQTYGGLGIHVFQVEGRPGLGVHAGGGPSVNSTLLDG